MPDSPDDNHWQFGAPQNLVDSRYAMKDAPWISGSTRDNFSASLRTFICDTFPEEPLRDDGEDSIQVHTPHSPVPVLIQDLTFSDSAFPMSLPPLHVPRELDGLLRHIAVQCLFPG
jgi:hypothetical protein